LYFGSGSHHQGNLTVLKEIIRLPVIQHTLVQAIHTFLKRMKNNLLNQVFLK
jgi:hypothetical protein